MTKTIGQLAKDALNVQDACNLSGVVRSFSHAMSDLRLALPDAGTDEINTHPICRVWADKIASLTQTQSISLVGTVTAAYTAVHLLAEHAVAPHPCQVDGCVMPDGHANPQHIDVYGRYMA